MMELHEESIATAISPERLRLARDTASEVFEVSNLCLQKLRELDPFSEDAVSVVKTQLEIISGVHHQLLRFLPAHVHNAIEHAAALGNLPPFHVGESVFATAHTAALWVGARLNLHKQFQEWCVDVTYQAALTRGLARRLPQLRLDEARVRLIKEWSLTARSIAGKDTAGPLDDKSGSSELGDEASLDQRAATAKALHPDWSDKQVADAIGCSRTTLFKPNFVNYKRVKGALASNREQYRRGRRVDRRRRSSNINRSDKV